MTRTMTRKPLRSLAPGDVVLGIDELRLVGPRGGKRVFRSMYATGSGLTFTHTTLNAAGTERTFHFIGSNGIMARPFTVSSALSCKLRARVSA